MILFLDFDGVLHPWPLPGRSGETDLFCSLHLLEDVLRHVPHVEVVISSSWREDHPLDEIREYFAEDLRDRIVGMTPLSDEDIELAPSDLVDYPRQTQCVAWLVRHRPAGTPWLAIDDMAEEFEPDCPQVLLVDGSAGLTSDSAALLLRRLLNIHSDQHLAVLQQPNASDKVAAVFAGRGKLARRPKAGKL